MNINTPEVREIVSRAFPQFNGRDYRIEPFQGPMSLASYWSGGNRDYFAGVNLASGQLAHVRENGTPWMPSVGELTALPTGAAIVQYHAGPNQFACVYVNADNLSGFLPAPVELGRQQRIVLCATRSLKSSYAGIKDYRFHEAASETGITREQWDAGKAACIAAGLLNKAGAITDSGRNAIGSVQLWTFKQA